MADGVGPGRPTPPAGEPATERNRVMLMTLFVILLLMWLVGMISSYTFGGFIHILLLVALVVVLIRIIEGRRPL